MLARDLKCVLLRSCSRANKAIIALFYDFITPPGRGAEYCDKRVCLSVCVCLYAIISSELHVQSSPIFMHDTCGSILLWRRSDTLRISGGFTDEVIFAIS